MKYRIFSLLLAVCFLMGAAVPAMAAEVVDTNYNYTPLPGFYMFYLGTNNLFGGAVSTSGTSFGHTLSTITETTNTHYKVKINADTAGQYDYISFVVFLDSDNVESVVGYLENATTSIATDCEYSVVSGSELGGTVGSYACTVLVDCSGFSGDVNVEISGHLGKGTNDFLVCITGYSVSSYSGVLVDYWDDTLELLRQILAELQKSNGFLSDIKTSLAGFRSDLVYWVQEVYSAIQLNFLTLTNFLNGFKSSVESGFTNVISSINTWGQSIRDAIVGEQYTEDDEFATEASDIIEVNDAYSEYLDDATPDISLNDYDPLGTFQATGVNFDSIGPVLLNLFSDNVLLDVIILSLTFSLVGYVLYGKR